MDRNLFYMNFIKKYMLVFQTKQVFLILSNLILIQFMISNSYGESPSFTRIDVRDSTNDLIPYKYLDNTDFQEIINKKIEEINEIRSVNYISNGKSLNVTFWLDKPFEEIPSTHYPIYVVLINVDADPFTGGSLGVDYRAKVLWNNDTKKWESILEEVSANEIVKILQKNENYTNFFQKYDEDPEIFQSKLLS